jgi:hypothetical protein
MTSAVTAPTLRDVRCASQPGGDASREAALEQVVFRADDRLDEFASEPLSSLASMRAWISSLDSGGLSSAALVDLLGELETLKNVACAAQARAAVAFDLAQRAEQRDAGVAASRLGRGVAEQVALARRESPSQGSRLLGLAKALCGSSAELPATMALLAAGTLSEWRATLIARETACLDPELRRAVDAEMAPTAATLSNRQLAAETRAAAYRLDPAGVLARRAHAAKGRYVSLRPAPESMTYLTALLPLRDGVACYAALAKAADAALAAGAEAAQTGPADPTAAAAPAGNTPSAEAPAEPRTRAQLMADLLVIRLTGLSQPGSAPVEVTLVMSDRALFGDEDPAYVPDYGPIPAAEARSWLNDEGATAWVRRVFTDPVSGGADHIDERRRAFPARLRRLIVARDRYCRTPWCGAPIRDLDHAHPHAAGGPTSLANGQGLCQRCNQAKTAPGWTARVVPPSDRAAPGAGRDAGRHAVRTRTPTGHSYDSTAPALAPPRTPAPPIFLPRIVPDEPYDDQAEFDD